MARTKYIDKLINENINKSSKKQVKLQVNMYIDEDKMENLKKLVALVKKSGKKASIKSVCEGALEDSGIFSSID